MFLSPINLNGNKLENLAAPANPTDAATKQYIDNAIAPLVCKEASTIGDGMNTTFTIRHNRGTQDVVVAIRNLETNKIVFSGFEILIPDATTVILEFNQSPAPDTYRVIII